MPEQDIDVNTQASDSSTEVAATGATEEVVKETASSTEVKTSQADLDKGFADAVKAGFEEATSKEPEGTPEEETKEVETPAEKADEEKEPEKKVEDDKGPIPYARFKEVNEAKQNLEQQLESQKEFVAAQKSIGDFCLANNVSNEEFSFWLNVAAKIKNSPEEALKMLAPQVQQLQAFQGDVLSPELQKAVDDGEMTLTWAKKLMANENKAKFSQQQTKLTQEQRQYQEVQRFQHEVQTSMHNWAKAKMATDPDFAPKKSAEAEDGKFEDVQAKLAALYPTANLRTVADIVAFAEKVYEAETKKYSKFKPQLAPTGSKVRSTNNGIANKNGTPKSFEEAVQLGARKAGVNFTLRK
jgi:hypothetical protein